MHNTFEEQLKADRNTILKAAYENRPSKVTLYYKEVFGIGRSESNSRVIFALDDLEGCALIKTISRNSDDYIAVQITHKGIRAYEYENRTAFVKACDFVKKSMKFVIFKSSKTILAYIVAALGGIGVIGQFIWKYL
ncbi:hypothetical protein ACROQ8_003640 [Yersinia enterocolitica]|uniref:Phage-like membrane protein n=1 Tax=Yersinia enterocolitica TaxID=630 RepID=A0A9P1PV34_YEREN|nr:hypothetical protein [Yersinia enterocolitica]EKN3636103.1 hypothetical protein [Yersinia enterocolitica]EME3601339.1 hypothetical protein [Yersinia enterocolitica]CNF56005.1 phage-like membrane protein [Yersinia enterocolitica]HDL7175477.1 hypothetical protein [Yersinia enterocolitica]